MSYEVKLNLIRGQVTDPAYALQVGFYDQSEILPSGFDSCQMGFVYASHKVGYTPPLADGMLIELAPKYTIPPANSLTFNFDYELSLRAYLQGVAPPSGQVGEPTVWSTLQVFSVEGIAPGQIGTPTAEKMLREILFTGFISMQMGTPGVFQDQAFSVNGVAPGEIGTPSVGHFLQEAVFSGIGPPSVPAVTIIQMAFGPIMQGFDGSGFGVPRVASVSYLVPAGIAPPGPGQPDVSYLNRQLLVGGLYAGGVGQPTLGLHLREVPVDGIAPGGVGVVLVRELSRRSNVMVLLTA